MIKKLREYCISENRRWLRWMSDHPLKSFLFACSFSLLGACVGTVLELDCHCLLYPLLVLVVFMLWFYPFVIRRDMRKKITALIIPCCVCLQAQTLTINSSGVVRLDPVPERMAELYASDSPRSQDWEFVREFAASTTVDTNTTKFYRAMVKPAPLQLVRIIETNQTLRGSVDKAFTNVTFVVNGVTNVGWAFGSAGLRGTNGNKMPVTTRMDFSFRQIHVTVPTRGTLTVWDDDGFVLVTNLWIGPGPFKPLLPRWYKPPTNAPTGIQPASVGDPQKEVSWSMVSHSASDFVAGPDIFTDPCTPSYQSSDGTWDEAGWRLMVSWSRCRSGKLERCGATFTAPAGGDGWMGRSSEYGICELDDGRAYTARSEVGAYDSNSDDEVTTSHFEHTGESRAELWVGGHLRGEEENYWIIIGMALETPTERLGGNQVFWGPAPSRFVSSIGGLTAGRAGKVAYQVPPEGILVDVTPIVKKMTSGWYLYGPNYYLLPNP